MSELSYLAVLRIISEERTMKPSPTNSTTTTNPVPRISKGSLPLRVDLRSELSSNGF